MLVTFNLTVGDPTYDLTDPTLFPSLVSLAIEEITKFSIILSPSPFRDQELRPVFDHETLIQMTFNTSTVQPVRYTMDANDYKVLRVDLPDNNYQAYIVGWAYPNQPSDTPIQTVPLIPPWGHNTIVLGLVAAIFSWQYGSKNDKTIDAEARYQQALLDLEEKKQFDPNYKLQLNLSESAIRST